MVRFNSLSTAALALFLSTFSAAHPEDHEMHEALHKRDAHAAVIQRGLEACAGHPEFIALQERGLQRRWAKAQELRAARGIDEAGMY